MPSDTVYDPKYRAYDDYPYRFKPKRDLTLEEINKLLEALFSLKVFPEEFYENLPEELQEHFEYRAELKEKN